MPLLVDIYQMPLHTEAPTQVGGSSWKSGHFSICGATVRSRGGYSSMYRGEDLQPVGDHQRHHPWVLSSNFYDQPRTLEPRLYAHLLRNGTHAQYGDQAKSRRWDHSTFHYLPGPLQLHGHFSQHDVFFIIILCARCISTTRTISWLTQIHTAYLALIESRICKLRVIGIIMWHTRLYPSRMSNHYYRLVLNIQEELNTEDDPCIETPDYNFQVLSQIIAFWHQFGFMFKLVIV